MSSVSGIAPQLLSFEEENRRTSEIVRDLRDPKPLIYWVDLLAACAVGWAAFGLAVRLPFGTLGMIGSAIVACFALYRALCFLHEISHFHQPRFPGFETAWNLLIGFPLLMPSFVYIGVHQSHHRASSYGTEQDPEYLPFASTSLMTLAFLLQSFLVPAVLLVRFLVFGPLGLASSRLRFWLIKYASSLAVNLQFRRAWTPELDRKVKVQTALILLIWGSTIALAAAGILPWRLFPIWFGVTAFASFINTLRTLGAHAYENSGGSLNRAGQLADSIDTPGGPWSELWAPVGLRYHALHHYFPGLPYHNLGEAHRRLVAALPDSALYRGSVSPSLFHSLRKLLVLGLLR